MKVLQILFLIINVPLIIQTLYFTLFGFWGLFRSTLSFEEAAEQRRFAVLIPARNEELVIGNLIDSILEADYPGHLIDIYVLINNCSDRTGEIAYDHGAEVLECSDGIRTKGDVLSFAFERLAADPSIDAFVVLDADNIVDTGFFREINNALAAGASIVQGRRTGKNLRNTPVSSCYEMFYMSQNIFFNHPRNSAGLSASVNGTGWAISRESILRTGFSCITVAEDYELTILSSIRNEKILYCSSALVYDEFTDSMRVSMLQRMRWSFGHLQNIREYEGRLIKKALRGSRQCFDAAMLNPLPVTVLILLFTPIPGYFIFRMPVSFTLFLLFSAASFWLSLSLSCLIGVLKSGDSVKRNLPGIISFPSFIITWVPVLIACLFKRDIEWTPIRHDQAITLEERRKADNS